MRSRGTHRVRRIVLGPMDDQEGEGAFDEAAMMTVDVGLAAMGAALALSTNSRPPPPAGSQPTPRSGGECREQRVGDIQKRLLHDPPDLRRLLDDPLAHKLASAARASLESKSRGRFLYGRVVPSERP